MFVYAKQEDSYKEHEHLLAMEQEMLAKVEVPYRIIDTAAGDLGSSAARKFDCEGLRRPVAVTASSPPPRTAPSTRLAA